MSEVSADTVVDCHGAHDIPVGWRRWLFATNHKNIGTPYLLFAMANLMIGGVMALMIPAELFERGLQTMRPEFFNQLVTEHGLIMIIGAIMPAFVGFGNWMIPLLIGASDMAFARVTNLSFWLLPVSSVLLLGSFWVPGGAPAAGWTMYASLSTQMGPGMDTSIFAIHIAGASSTMRSHASSPEKASSALTSSKFSRSSSSDILRTEAPSTLRARECGRYPRSDKALAP
jgi:cytochrome c oxidase subunit 1